MAGIQRMWRWAPRTRAILMAGIFGGLILLSARELSAQTYDDTSCAYPGVESHEYCGPPRRVDAKVSGSDVPHGYASFPAAVIGQAADPLVVDPVIDVISVQDSFVISDVDVLVDATHTFSGDLEIDLISPAGTAVRLYDHSTAGLPYLPTAYDDDGAPGTAPVDGPGLLSDFDGEDSMGDWSLRVSDTVPTGFDGVLDAWHLTLSEFVQPVISFGSSPVVDTIEVSAAGIITDVDVPMDITHTWIGDLSIELQSPSGTTVLLHGQTGFDTDDIVGTYDDEDPAFAPAGSLSDFDGEERQGVWTLTVQDSFVTDDGILNGWAVDTAAKLTIDDSQPTISVIPISDQYDVWDLDVSVEIRHPNIGDLAVEVTSPDLTTVRLHNFNGGVLDDIVATYDDDGAAGTIPPVGPGLLSDFDLAPVTGDWTLTVTDVQPLNDGTLDGWCLHFQNTPGALVTDTAPPLVEINSVPTYGLLGDVDVLLDLTHSWAGDLAIDVTSPGGTTVRLHDHTGGSAPLTPPIRYDDEGSFGTVLPDGPGALADFDGAERHGDWTLTVADTGVGDDGVLGPWCLLFLDFPHFQACWSRIHEFCSTTVQAIGGPPASDVIVDTITVADSIAIYDLDVQVDLTHTFAGDLEIDLLGPTGTAVTLHSGGGSQGYFPTTYDDDLTPGSVAPHGPGTLSDYDGLDSAGDWTLTITDTSPASDDGTFFGWCLLISDTPPVVSAAAGPTITTAEVAEGIVIEDTNVTVDVEHPAVEELTVELEHLGVTVRLHDGGGAEADLQLTFDDAGDPYGSLPFDATSTVQPSGPGSLADFDGLDSSGIWSLTVTDAITANDGQMNSWCLEFWGDQVACDPNLQAAFSASTQLGPAPLCVDFLDASSGDVESWSWTFGDGSSATGPSPSHTFEAGTYDVTLDIAGCSAADWLTLTAFVTALAMGDVNGDGIYDLADPTALASFLFAGGSAPACLRTADVNDDGAADLGDVVYMLMNLFAGGAAPVTPPPCSPCGL